jgi:glutamine amidotransferase-like uncharacterized protein
MNINKKSIIGLIMIFIIISINVFCISVDTKVNLVADVLIYRGSGVLSNSVISFEKFLDWKGLTWTECDDIYVENNDLLQNFRVIYFPGGDFSRYVSEINNIGLQHIKDFIGAGGGYIGICGGSYFACDRVNWRGNIYDYSLDLFNGIGYGPIEEIAPYIHYVMTIINIESSNPINQYEPISEDVMYYGGAAFYLEGNQDINVIGTYDRYNNDMGIINFNYGSGRVVLIGPHPEFEEDSTRDGVDFGEELDDNGTDWNLLWTCMDWLMNVPISLPPIPMPPKTPTITGPFEGKIKQTTNYSVTTTDPNGDNVSYFIEWGDNSTTGWTTTLPSGEYYNSSHTWSEEGDYIIKAKAKDIYGAESNWGTLTVSMPKSYIYDPIIELIMKLLKRFPFFEKILNNNYN